MNKHINGLVACCSLGVSLLLAGPAWSVAAPDAAGDATQAVVPQAAAALQQLDEIVLQGKRLEQRVREAEERFYKRYNKLNADDSFDVSCDYDWVDRSSIRYSVLGAKRGCVPVFFAEAVAARVGNNNYNYGWMGRGSMAYGWAGSGPVGSCISTAGSPAVSRDLGSSQLAYYWPGPDGNCAPYISTLYFQPATPSVEPQLVWLNRRAEFVANLGKVLQSDPQLQAMARQLDALALEGRQTEENVAQARKVRLEEKLAARKCTQPVSPRAGMVCATG